MKHEIKFRGKCFNNGLWIDGDLITSLTPKGKMTKCPAIHTTYGTIGTFFVQSETVGQYIGLRDKHGKEAYIGDIVRFTPKVLNIIGSGYVKTDYELLAVIDTDEYNHSILCILHDKGRFKKGEFYHIEGVLNGEIIGNQYDNHELLED